MRGLEKRCCHQFPPERVVHVDGTLTSGFETGSVETDGQECDLIIVTRAIPWGREEG